MSCRIAHPPEQEGKVATISPRARPQSTTCCWSIRSTVRRLPTTCHSLWPHNSSGQVVHKRWTWQLLYIQPVARCRGIHVLEASSHCEPRFFLCTQALQLLHSCNSITSVVPTTHKCNRVIQSTVLNEPVNKHGGSGFVLLGIVLPLQCL